MKGKVKEMKQVYDDCYSKAYQTEKGTRIVLFRDSNIKYWSVFVRRSDEKKGKTIATRCTFEKAMSIAKQLQ